MYRIITSENIAQETEDKNWSTERSQTRISGFAISVLTTGSWACGTEKDAKITFPMDVSDSRT